MTKIAKDTKSASRENGKIVMFVRRSCKGLIQYKDAILPV